MKSYNTWLESAYLIFAKEGPDNLSIKSLSEYCNLPRTNFYYYFDNKEDLIDNTIELHFKTTTEIFNIELTKRMNTFMPDLYTVISDFKTGIQFAKILFTHRENPKYNIAYVNGISLSANIIVPKFKEYFNIQLTDKEVRDLYFTLTDTWFSRLKFDDFSVENMCHLTTDIMESILPLIKKQYLVC